MKFPFFDTRLLAGLITGAMVGLLIYVAHLRGEVAEVRSKAAAAEARAASFQSQAKLNARTIEITEAQYRNTAKAISDAEEASSEVQNAPDIEAAVAAFHAGIVSVRASGSAELADSRPDLIGSNAGG